MSLAAVNPGRAVRLLAVQAGGNLQGRLVALGLVPGVKIEVTRNSGHGPLLIGVGSTRLMLGRGVAEKVLVA